ncbi:MAG: carbon-nitrogen hydrolase family protein [Gammaproteobacteria bacterium]|nr:carbon-nitrogen hydrolase family protein [Gammaproteobacteria bacterium]
MNAQSLTVALITDVFPHRDEEERLLAHLRDAKTRGAQLAVLPELPLNRWAPVNQIPSDADAEPPYGPRESAMAVAARATGLAVLGGAIVRDQANGRRHNTAVLFGADGEELLRYRKIHLPDEDGYWEAHHYDPGGELQAPADVGGFGIGVQVCSDANRPQGCTALAAMGADAILLPRATPAETYPRWRLVLRANAVTSCAYVISVNRPGTRSQGVIGGPSMVAGPSGEVLLETRDPVATITLEKSVLARARQEYPGYLDVRADVYEGAWRAAQEGRDR